MYDKNSKIQKYFKKEFIFDYLFKKEIISID
jgi:hypothetical protein